MRPVPKITDDMIEAGKTAYKDALLDPHAQVENIFSDVFKAMYEAIIDPRLNPALPKSDPSICTHMPVFSGADVVCSACGAVLG